MGPRQSAKAVAITRIATSERKPAVVAVFTKPFTRSVLKRMNRDSSTISHMQL